MVEIRGSDQSMSHEINIRVVSTRADWASLQPVWNPLLLRTPFPTIYLTYEWLTSWWNCVPGPNVELHILVAERGGNVEAIAPLMKVSKREGGIPIRKIQFISTMRKAEHLSTLSPHLDIIAPPDAGEGVGAIFGYLAQEESAWDYLQLHPAPDESLTLSTFPRSALGFNAHLLQPVLHSSLLRIGCTWDEYVQQHRHDFKKVMRNASGPKQAVNEFRVTEYSSLDQLPGGFDTLLDIERRSWKWTKGVSLNSALFKGFYRKVAQNLGGTGFLIVHILEMQGRPIAYNYAVQFGNKIWGLRMIYDAASRNRAPGKILLYHLLKIAHQSGITAIDFGWGEAHGQYKDSMTNAGAQYSELMVFARSSRGEIARRYFHSRRVRLAVDQATDFTHRIARHLGIHLANSELTREDQL